jgi:hypothetical protein
MLPQRRRRMSRRSLGRRSPSSSVKEAACATPVLSEIKDTPLSRRSRKSPCHLQRSEAEGGGSQRCRGSRALRPPTRNHRRAREAQAIAFWDEWE